MNPILDKEMFSGSVTPPVRSQLVALINNSWNFIDPNTLEWEALNEFTDFHVAQTKMGIVLSNFSDPSMIAEMVQVGQTIYRDVTSAPNTFWATKGI